jgi:hypothetical protein
MIEKSLIRSANLGKFSAMAIPGTEVAMALVGPPDRTCIAASAKRGNQPDRLAPPNDAIAIRIISRLEKQLFVTMAILLDNSID